VNPQYDLIGEHADDIAAGGLVYLSCDTVTRLDRGKLMNDQLCLGGPAAIAAHCNFAENLEEVDGDSPCAERMLYLYLVSRGSRVTVDRKLRHRLLLCTANAVAISGDSGSGKTRMSKAVADIWPSQSTLQLECDRYHKWERGDARWSEMTHLHPQANYLVKMKRDFFHLKMGMDVFQVDYDHATGKFTAPEEIHARENIVLCGLHSLRDAEVNQHSNVRIYMDPEERLRKRWKVERDVARRGYTPEQVIQRMEERHSDAVRYIQPQRSQADIIVQFYEKTNGDIGLRVLLRTVTHVQPLLRAHKLKVGHTLVEGVDFAVLEPTDVSSGHWFSDVSICIPDPDPLWHFLQVLVKLHL